MTREEAKEILTHNWTRVDNPNYSESELDEAFFMAIEALSKPNYETDTEVRLAVMNRKKEKVILWDAFEELEYYPIEALSVANLKEEFESAECEDYEHATLVDIKEPLKVLVVRCKDCKWAEKAIFDEYCVECTMHHTTFMKHGFCNHGERREPTE